MPTKKSTPTKAATKPAAAMPLNKKVNFKSPMVLAIIGLFVAFGVFFVLRTFAATSTELATSTSAKAIYVLSRDYNGMTHTARGSAKVTSFHDTQISSKASANLAWHAQVPHGTGVNYALFGFDQSDWDYVTQKYPGHSYQVCADARGTSLAGSTNDNISILNEGSGAGWTDYSNIASTYHTYCGRTGSLVEGSMVDIDGPTGSAPADSVVVVARVYLLVY